MRDSRPSLVFRLGVVASIAVIAVTVSIPLYIFMLLETYNMPSDKSEPIMRWALILITLVSAGLAVFVMREPIVTLGGSPFIVLSGFLIGAAAAGWGAVIIGRYVSSSGAAVALMAALPVAGTLIATWVPWRQRPRGAR